MPTSSFERIVVSSGASKTLNGGTYTNSESYAGNGGAAEVLSGGTLNTNDAVFTSNQVTSSSGSKKGKGGALYNDGTTNVSGGSFNSNQGQNGGAIFNSGAMTISGATFSGNSAGNLGGAIYNSCGTLNVTGGTFSGNDVENNGAGIYVSSGTLNVSGASFIGNNSPKYGGAISLNKGTVNVSGGSFVSNSAKNAAAIYNYSGSVEVIDATFSGNTVTSTGGAIYTRDMLYVSGGSFVGNSAGTLGGAICNLSGGTANVSGAAFSGNTAASGGAICNLSGGTVNVIGGSFSGNAASQGGAIYNSGAMTISGGAIFSGNSASHMGGAIYTLSGGTATISGATFSGNSAGIGGAIENDGGTMAIFNATFAGNSASFGGAIDIFSGAVANLSDVNFSGNVASLGGAILNEGGATVNLLGAVTLATADDDIDNASGAVINWDLTNAAPGSAVVLNGYQNLSNKGDLTITVNAEQTKGNYTIATGNFDSIVGKNSFTLKTTDDAGTAITVGGGAVEYKGLTYTLAVQNDNALVLNVVDVKPITYTVSGDGEYTYDGKDHAITVSVTDPSSGAKVFYSIDGKESWIEGSSFSAKNFGIFDVNFKIEATGYETTITEARTITITKRDITLKSETLTKEYDGTALVGGGDVTDVTAGQTDKGYVSGEEFAYSFTGSQLFVGTSENEFSIGDSATALVSNYDVTSQYGKLTVTGRTSPLTITVYDQEKVYDGTAVIDTSKDVYEVEGLATGDTITVTITNTNINAGYYEGGITVSSYKIMHGDTDVTSMYLNVTIDKGDLTINKRELTVVGTAVNGKTYDGNTKAVIGTMGSLDNVVPGDDVAIDTATATFADKDAGNGKDVTVTYTLTGDKAANYTVSSGETIADIDKRAITLRSEDFTKEYDGTALMCGGTIADLTAGETDKGYVSGEEFAYSFFGKQLFVGTSENEFSIGDSATALVSNYDATLQYGELSVTPRTSPLTITVKDQTKLYDGNATIKAAEKGVTYTVDGELASGDTLTVTLVNTNVHAGTYADGITAIYSITHSDGTDVTSMYANVTVDAGDLTVNQRSVTLTSGSAEKDCDGLPLTNSTVTVSGDGFIDGEGATYDVTGSQTEIGTSQNTFTYELNDGTLASDYAVTKVEGTLTVNSVDPLIIKEGGAVTISEDSSYEEIQVSKDAELTVAEGTTLEIGLLTLDEGSSFQNDGTAEISALNVTGKDAAISGNLLTVDAIALAEEASLGLNKDQYDLLLAGTQFESAEGKLIVSESIGNALRTQDIDALMAKENLSAVEFKQDLIDVRELTFKAGKDAAIGFRNAYGTNKSDTIRFYKDSEIVLGTEDGIINLEEGSNKIQADKNATVGILSDLTNVSTIKTVSGSTVAMSDIEFQIGRNATLKAEGASFKAGVITGTDKKTTIKIGKGTEFTAETIAFADKSDKISTGKESIFTAGNVFSADTISLGAYSTTELADVSGVKKFTLSSGKEDKAAVLKAAAVTGTEKGDTFNFGSWNEVDLTSVDFGEGSDTLKIGSHADVNVSGLLDFGDGKSDKLTISKYATLSVDSLDVDSLDSLTMGKDAYLCIGNDDDLAAAQEKWSKYADQIVSKLA